MKKAAVYTRTGDKGFTGLVGGTRIKKSDPRISLYGEIDELNSYIGFAISNLEKGVDKTFLHKIQSALFDLGSNMACEKELRIQYQLPQIKETLIQNIEFEIDKMDNVLKPLKSFILPGGSLEASAFHICRTVCRRIERELIFFEDKNPGEVPEVAQILMNRLSDYFFIYARYLNQLKKIEEINWTSEKSK